MRQRDACLVENLSRAETCTCLCEAGQVWSNRHAWHVLVILCIGNLQPATLVISDASCCICYHGKPLQHALTTLWTARPALWSAQSGRRCCSWQAGHKHLNTRECLPAKFCLCL